MKRIILTLLLIASLTLPLRGQEERRLSSKIVYVIDISCSMTGSIDQAFDLSQQSMFSAVDELEVAVIVFNDEPIQWTGMPDTPSWGKLPDMAVADSIKAFLGEHRQGGGNTVAGTSLLLALEQKTDIQDLSILLVTDSIFDDRASVPGMVALGQSRRKFPAALFCLMIGASDYTHLNRLTEANNGRVFKYE